MYLVSNIVHLCGLCFFSSGWSVPLFKGPIPGTPVVVSGWRGGVDTTNNTDENADCTTNTMKKSSGSDSGNGNSNSSGRLGFDEDTTDDGKTPLIEKEHVQAVYDTIAPHW